MTLLPLLLLYPLGFALFHAPGLGFASWLVRRYAWPTAWSCLLAIVPAAALGYLVFWSYFLHPMAGLVASGAVLGASVGCGIALRQALRSCDVAWPLALTFLTGLCYLGFLFTDAAATPPETRANVRFGLPLGGDNFLPFLFAEHLYAGTDPRQLHGDWHSSDRPPLQTGMVLVQRPLADLIGSPGLQYQILGTIFQCTWVPAVWALFRLAGLGGRRLALALALCLTSFFFLFHSVYVWPKLLAGVLAIVPVLLLVWPGGRVGRNFVASDWPSVLVAALAGGLALLAHAGVGFALIGLALFLLRPAYFPGLGKTLAGCAVVAGLLAPWSAYQRDYDPPGDRLLKWHLAGVIPAEDTRPFARALADAYATLTPAEFARHKGANVAALFGQPLLDPTYPGDTWYKTWRHGEYYNVLKALGVLNVGWVVLILGRRDPALAVARTLLAVALPGLVVWLLVLFEPGAALVYQSSFAMMLLLVAALVLATTALPGRVVAALVAFQVLSLLVFWTFNGPPPGAVDVPMLLLTTATAGGLVVCLRQLAGIARV